MRDALEASSAPPESAKLEWRPSTTVTLDEERAAGVLKLLDVLDDNDDVQNVYANFDIPDAVMQKLSADQCRRRIAPASRRCKRCASAGDATADRSGCSASIPACASPAGA